MRQVKGLAVAEVARLVASRGDMPFESVDDIWKRAGVQSATLEKLARADAFRSLDMDRRQASWKMKGMRDEPLALWAAADDREARNMPEAAEPAVVLKAMTAGREVVEDYSRIGLTLREHPLAFLRNDLRRRRIVTCAEAMSLPDGRWTFTAGLVLVRQRPGSARGVMFATIEDESGIANIVVWPSLFEKQRSVVLGASMLAVNGRIQREGDVVHLVAQRLFDLTSDLSSLSDRDGEAFALPHGRGDELRHGPPGPDSRSPKEPMQVRDIYVPDLHIDTLKVKSRNFH